MGSIIIGACSGDDDYDDYAGKELQTRADGMIPSNGESGSHWGEVQAIRIGNGSATERIISTNSDFYATVNFSWNKQDIAENQVTRNVSSVSIPDTTIITPDGTSLDLPMYSVRYEFLNRTTLDMAHIATSLNVYYRTINYNQNGAITKYGIEELAMLTFRIDVTSYTYMRPNNE